MPDENTLSQEASSIEKPIVRFLGPELAEIRAHRDREGGLAFYSVRFLGLHQLVYTGEFEVRFQPDPRRRP